MSGKLVGVLAVVLLVLAGGFWLLDWGGSPASENPPKTNPPDYASAPSTPEPTPNQIYETIKPKETPGITQAPPETKEPVKEYVDASMGDHTFGDKVSYLEEKGILTGTFVDGKPLTGIMLTSEDGKTVLHYRFQDHPTYGHLELISYPQRGEKGEVYIKINGVDSGCVFTSGFSFNLYLENLVMKTFAVNNHLHLKPNESGNDFWILEC